MADRRQLPDLRHLQPHRRALAYRALREFGLPFPLLAFAIAMVLQFAGIVLLATGWYDEIGAACLIAFTVIATLLYHRFWTKVDPAQRIAARQGMIGNTAIVGGLLLLLQNAL